MESLTSDFNLRENLSYMESVELRLMIMTRLDLVIKLYGQHSWQYLQLSRLIEKLGYGDILEDTSYQPTYYGA